MMAYRPLNVDEVGSVAGLDDEEVVIRALVDRCASFIKIQSTNIEFVHQSARDYLAGENGQSMLDLHENYGHDEIALSCLSHLSKRLKVNLVELLRPDSTRESLKTLQDKEKSALLNSVDYAATFWVQHLESTKRTAVVQNALAERGSISTFLRTRVLEWLECLSLLDELPRAFLALRALTTIAKDKPFVSILVQDATQFLLQHYDTLTNWPLQTYSSALTFSPETSVVRRENLGKIPAWLRKIPHMEDSWPSLIQISGYSGYVKAVAFSPDSKQIASGSNDATIKLWDATTGELQNTLTGHSDWVNAVAFSPDGKQIASGSDDRTIKLWDATTGELQNTLTGHLESVKAVAFSPDGKQIASGSDDRTIKLWDATTGELQNVLVGDLQVVNAVAFSPDSKQIASGSDDRTIKLWDATTGELQNTLTGHSGWVKAVAFSPDSKQIASGSGDRTIKLWDATTGELQNTLTGHSGWVNVVTFSPDGKQIASGSNDDTVKLWDATTGELQNTLTGHFCGVMSLAFSPDGKHIASGCYWNIRLWDTTTGDLQNKLVGHSGYVNAVAFSPDGKQIASGSDDQTIRLWDVAKSLKLFQYLGRTISRLFSSHSWHKIKTSKPINTLKFSASSRYLATNIGPINTKSILADRQGTVLEPFEDIWVTEKWIHCGTAPVLRLPPGVQALCYDVQGTQVAIGATNGRILTFGIDCSSLSL
ncbi:WD40 repeat domain-containing protein [Aspergillus chevalieri]|uniref:Uncharacterized protein n=1 Tax=Aspergillus chevalieri TaxID=182096 RepID=A0A7R7ZKU7_ASPCH|nr:uncharacterized protein ACHE_21231A [Aspergillus chevalieri]BCR85773.1 hypothetical protein ACHE_21231A [Aspergillus chevalieri]